MPLELPEAKDLRIRQCLPVAIAESWSASRLAREARIRKEDASRLLKEAQREAVQRIPEDVAAGYQAAGREAALKAQTLVRKLIAAAEAKAEAVADDPVECGRGALSEATEAVNTLIEISRRLTGAAHLERLEVERVKVEAGMERQDAMIHRGVLDLGPESVEVEDHDEQEE